MLKGNIKGAVFLREWHLLKNLRHIIKINCNENISKVLFPSVGSKKRIHNEVPK